MEVVLVVEVEVMEVEMRTKMQVLLMAWDVLNILGVLGQGETGGTEKVVVVPASQMEYRHWQLICLLWKT